MRPVLATVVQMIWGLPQFIVGGLICLFCTLQGGTHQTYRTALVTFWRLDRGLSLGPFIFLPSELSTRQRTRLITHEYGHTIQSLLLGPLYLLLIVLPSLIWAGVPALERMRTRNKISYYSFYTERWANKLAKQITGDTPDGM